MRDGSPDETGDSGTGEGHTNQHPSLGSGQERPGEFVSAGNRPAWAAALPAGVQRVGHGIIDERAKMLSWEERRIAEVLAEEGCVVVAVAAAHGRERRRDADVDGVPTEFKTLFSPRSAALSRLLGSGLGQAPHVVVDARWCRLSELEAYRGGRRFLGTPYGHRLESFRILGPSFDVGWSRERGWWKEGE